MWRWELARLEWFSEPPSAPPSIRAFKEAPGVGTFIIDLALTEVNSVPHLVLLQVSAEDYDALHEAVFLPAVEALSSME